MPEARQGPRRAASGQDEFAGPKEDSSAGSQAAGISAAANCQAMTAQPVAQWGLLAMRVFPGTRPGPVFPSANQSPPGRPRARVHRQRDGRQRGRLHGRSIEEL